MGIFADFYTHRDTHTRSWLKKQAVCVLFCTSFLTQAFGIRAGLHRFTPFKSACARAHAVMWGGHTVSVLPHLGVQMMWRSGLFPGFCCYRQCCLRYSLTGSWVKAERIKSFHAYQLSHLRSMLYCWYYLETLNTDNVTCRKNFSISNVVSLLCLEVVWSSVRGKRTGSLWSRTVWPMSQFTFLSDGEQSNLLPSVVIKIKL